MSIEQRQQEVVEEFELFDDWMDKYEHIIALGKSLPMINDEYKDDAHLIRGCQSQVWLHAEPLGKTIHFTADSDAIITKGLVSLMIRVLNDQAAEDIAKVELDFIDKIGLHEHLSPTRSNGLRSMIKQMKLYGLAVAASQNTQRHA